jgi:uncharacterized protein (DUF305 family)
MKRLMSSVALALAAALALAGCGSNDPGTTTSSSSPSSNFNDADVTFAQSMIPHHQQAVEMADMARTHASAADVKQLADKIEAAQGPEITTMTGWLEDWGQQVPSGAASDTDDMGHDTSHDMDSMGPSDMPGIMSEGDMKALDAAIGAKFDQMFLTMMVEHHSGAIEMAQTEQSDGKNPDAVALAKTIEADQNTEITQMQDLLNS